MLSFDALIAISSYVKKRILAQGYKGKVYVVPNIAEKTACIRKRRAGPVRIVYLGALTKSKGVDIMLNAVRGLSNYELCIYGDGPLKKWILAFAKANSINLKLCGFRKNISEVYCDSDLVVFPSLWPEPFGRIAVEAQAYGVPVIAARAGGISEILDAEHLVEPGNSGQLHNKIRDFIAAYSKKKMKAVSLKKYSPESVSKQMKKIYG